MTKQTIAEPVSFDYIIFGFGKAGKTLASFYANKGKTVAVIEKSAEMYGGTCINVACIPSKSLVKSSRQSKELQLPDFAAKAAFYRQAIEVKSNLTAMLRGKNYNKLAQHPKIKVYTGKGSFISEKEIEVETETEILKLQADQIIINTGSLPFFSEIEGLVGNPRVYTSESLMDLARLPERLLIIGGGRISLEFASIYSSFGSQVTVLNRGPRLLKQEDEDIAKEITSILQQAGIHFEFNADAESVSYDLDQAVVTFRDARVDRRQIRVDAVLVATGRTANIKELNLSAAGVEISETGAIKVDSQLRTTAADVWAVGDVAGSPQFTYIS
ncbi:MAG: FAD-dependent oxidoreductase, partial [Ruminococcaceae bacterium]|nr:FAD-dependent oxidoreductase [Oscillospiraceae bacterium]